MGEHLKNAILQNSKTPSSESNRGAGAQRDLNNEIHEKKRDGTEEESVELLKKAIAWALRLGRS